MHVRPSIPRAHLLRAVHHAHPHRHGVRRTCTRQHGMDLVHRHVVWTWNVTWRPHRCKVAGLPNMRTNKWNARGKGTRSWIVSSHDQRVHGERALRWLGWWTRPCHHLSGSRGLLLRDTMQRWSDPALSECQMVHAKHQSALHPTVCCVDRKMRSRTRAPGFMPGLPCIERTSRCTSRNTRDGHATGGGAQLAHEEIFPLRSKTSKFISKVKPKTISGQRRTRIVLRCRWT